ncbi:protein phosphatase 1A-like [Tigriopus californicus]|uniref:protein phosphatase 1A-like n=1 Tax=Tigriopus californicus TaxID=6832 RepID=UPI0027DA1183|nr:protein phosphatase 1A-like [Tigriopus californicus]
MGAFLDKPKTEKYNESNAGGDLRYGLSSMQGWRIEMEDAHTAMIGLPNVSERVSWFAVFDGHAGSRVSAHCSHHMLNCILTHDKFKSAILKEKSQTQGEFLSEIQGSILDGFLELDEKLRKIPEVANGEDKSGTTAVCALITEKYVLFSNCGDSRAVLCSAGEPALVTLDHKPSNPLEQERIENAGGSVMIQRVNGSLAVSRALGDFEYKNVDGKGPTEQLVSPEPEFYIRERSLADDEFLVLACDGVWDVMSNKDICNFVRHRLLVKDDLEAIANEVIDTCLHKGSRDNMSIPGAPKPNQQSIDAETAVDNKLKARMKELADEDGSGGFQAICQKMSEESWEGLPPSGELFAKRSMLEEEYKLSYPEKHSEEVSPCPHPMASLLYTNANQSPIQNDK